ncbi:unnamed protein product, partial [Timema podura]|nr:unnamed protein product [Timema podura]
CVLNPGPRHNHHLSLGQQTEVESSSRRRTRPILLETNRHEPPQRPRKGHGHLYPSRRISNGDVAEVGQFPWQVALSIDRHTACGASLISEEWVLTAAHCVYNKSNVSLLIGSRNRQREDEGSLEMTSKEFIVHPKYSQGTNYDLALIKLPRVVLLTGQYSQSLVGYWIIKVTSTYLATF